MNGLNSVLISEVHPKLFRTFSVWITTLFTTLNHFLRYWSTSKDPNMAYLKTCSLSFLILIAFLVETDAVRCCLSYTKSRPHCGMLKGYDIQTMTGGCDLAAIIFHRHSGKLVCADPAQHWTQKRVACLKMKAARVKSGGF